MLAWRVLKMSTRYLYLVSLWCIIRWPNRISITTTMMSSCSRLNLMYWSYRSVSLAMKTREFSRYLITTSLNWPSWFTGVIFTNFSFMILEKLKSKLSMIDCSFFLLVANVFKKVWDSRSCDILIDYLTTSLKLPCPSGLVPLESIP